MPPRTLSLSAAVLLAATLAATATRAAEVYRHVDKDGVVHYSDQPPTKGAKPAVLPPIRVVGAVGGRPMAGSSPGATAPKAGPAGPGPLSVSILSPAPGQAVRSADHLLPVSLRMNQPLPEGHGLLYLLDGTARNAEPTRALNFTFVDVGRGEHRVEVATVDAVGREIARTPPVVVHMKPPGTPLTPERASPPSDPAPRPIGSPP